MTGSYWNRQLHQHRINRRRALSGAAGLGVSALFAACGGASSGSSAGNAGSEKSGLVATPLDTSKQATRGGIWPQIVNSDSTDGFEMMASPQRRPADEASHVYSRLLKYKIGTFDNPPQGEVEADSATSWEVSPDHLQVTLKIRPNHRYDPRPPTNNRPMDSGDVKFTWDRFVAKSVSRGDLAKSANPEAPVEDVLTPDASTVVFKMAYPLAPVLQYLAYIWYLPLFPKEADSSYDPRSDLRGTGPWMLTKYEPSVIYEYRRNPNWYDAARRPFFDGKSRYVVPDYAAALSQFISGKVWSYDQRPAQTFVRAEDIVPTKRREPRLVLQYNDALISQLNNFVLAFSGRSNSPFLDERVRRAVSMLIDRDAYFDAFFNVSGFAKEGLSVSYKWNSHISAAYSKYWLDPKSDKLGEGAKYFKRDPVEAKKLLDAAGKFGMQSDWSYFPSGGFSVGVNPVSRVMEALAAMIGDEGHLKLKPNVVDYGTVYTPKYTLAKTDFDGIALYPNPTYPDIDAWLSAVWTPTGRNAATLTPLPKIHDWVQQQRRETDDTRRTSLIQSIEKELSVQMTAVPLPGTCAQGFNLAWPVLANYGYYMSYEPNYSSNQDVDTLIWYDRSKETT
jgi:ABC-type transport system substrate-binding protein